MELLELDERVRTLSDRVARGATETESLHQRIEALQEELNVKSDQCENYQEKLKRSSVRGSDRSFICLRFIPSFLHSLTHLFTYSYLWVCVGGDRIDEAEH